MTQEYIRPLRTFCVTAVESDGGVGAPTCVQPEVCRSPEVSSFPVDPSLHEPATSNIAAARPRTAHGSIGDIRVHDVSDVIRVAAVRGRNANRIIDRRSN